MKTLKKIGAATLIIISALTFNLQAQTEAPSKFKISVGPEIGLPVGDLSDRYDWSLGGTIEAEYSIAEDLGLTFNTGFYNLFADNSGYILNETKYTKDLQVLPVKLGLKYFVAGGLFVQGEAGASFLLNKSDSGYDKSTAFIYAPQIGYRIGLSNNEFIDASVKWEGSTKYSSQGSSNNLLGLRIAYGFGL